MSIKTIAATDEFLSAILNKLYAALDKAVTTAAHGAIERKVKACEQAENKVLDLEDTRADRVAHYAEAKARLRDKFEKALMALDNVKQAELDKIDGELAAAALAIIKAEDDYNDTVDQARVMLGVEAHG